MDCSRVEQLAETYGLGQLSHSTMAALEEHAAHCPRCEARLLACTGLGGELDDALMAMAEPSRDLLSRIYDSMPVQGVAESNLCYSLGPQLSALVDGELAGEDGLRVTEHLESCEYCARRLQALEEQAGVLATVREEPSARCAARQHVQPEGGERMGRRLAERRVHAGFLHHVSSVEADRGTDQRGSVFGRPSLVQ